MCRRLRYDVIEISFTLLGLEKERTRTSNEVNIVAHCNAQSSSLRRTGHCSFRNPTVALVETSVTSFVSCNTLVATTLSLGTKINMSEGEVAIYPPLKEYQQEGQPLSTMPVDQKIIELQSETTAYGMEFFQ